MASFVGKMSEKQPFCLCGYP